MKYKTLDDFDFRGKKVLLRSDLNSEVVNEKVILGERIIESARTVRELRGKGARVVILAHQGQKGNDDFISLKQHTVLLNKFTKVKFVNDVVGKKALSEIENLKNGEALLLDNVRFVKDEFYPFKKKNVLIEKFKGLFDIYINDAFSVCHREQTSIVSFPKYLEAGIGRLMERELLALEKINVKNCLFIIGGNKVEDEIKLLRKGRKILSGGYLSLLALIAKGHNLGYENKILRKELKFIPRMKKYLKDIETPVDLAVSVRGRRVEIGLDELPSNYQILDIGKETVNRYVAEVKKVRAVFMKGPVGHTGFKEFSFGTERILKAIASSRAFSVLGGGHLTTAMDKFGISPRKFGYVSLSGGALISYLAGEKLPGLEALKKK